MFSENQIKKTYWALVKDIPPEIEGTLVHYMKKVEKQNKSYCYPTQIKDSKRAELDYKLLGRSTTFYLLEVNLKTGRHHQIRAQLAHMGCAIKGDLSSSLPKKRTIAIHIQQASILGITINHFR